MWNSYMWLQKFSTHRGHYMWLRILILIEATTSMTSGFGNLILIEAATCGFAHLVLIVHYMWYWKSNLHRGHYMWLWNKCRCIEAYPNKLRSMFAEEYCLNEFDYSFNIHCKWMNVHSKRKDKWHTGIIKWPGHIRNFRVRSFRDIGKK